MAKIIDIFCGLCGEKVFDARSGNVLKNFRTDTFGQRKIARCNQCTGQETRQAKEEKKNVK